jgi:hypothetical protein
MDLKSTIGKQGRYVTQVIHYIHGEKKTIFDIDTTTIIQGEFTKMWDKDGRLYMVNAKNVLQIEVFKQ